MDYVDEFAVTVPVAKFIHLYRCDPKRSYVDAYIEVFEPDVAREEITHRHIARARRMLGKEKIQACVRHFDIIDAEKSRMDTSVIITELFRMATVNLRDFFDNDGELKTLANIDPATTAAANSFDLLKGRISVHDKIRALAVLAEMVGSMDGYDASIDDRFEKEMDAASKRV